MTKIVYIYSDNVEVEPFSQLFETCKIDLSDCQDKSLSSIYSRLGKEITNAAALIIDRKCGITESEIFDLATYVRLSHDQSWDIPMMVYDNESGTKDFYALYKADQTGISKTQRFELLSEKMAFEDDILTGETGLQRLIKIMMQQKLEWQTFINAIEVKNSAKDNHTIANEWAIHRWSQTIGVEDEAILKNYNEINSSLYFKYLQAVHPILDSGKIDKQHLRIEGLENKKILYIDDEAEKGWYEIFKHIFYDINGADFSYLCEELAGKSQAEIIETSLSKTIGSDANKEKGKADADIVILDFRLHEKDLQSDINEITGLKILKKIKEHNPGIQVIVFSATNKVWNLEAIQKAGADGFIIKESPNNIVSSDFTFETVRDFHNKLVVVSSRLFLKDVFQIFNPLIRRIDITKNLKPQKYKGKIPQGDILKYWNFLQSAKLLLQSHPFDLKFIFLQLVLIIEDVVKNSYFSSENNTHYVEVDIFTKHKCLEIFEDRIQLKIAPLNRWTKFTHEDFDLFKDDDDHKYFNTKADRVLFNYRLSAVLFFKYNIDLETASKFSSLYRLRSSSVAHIGSSKVEVSDVLLAITLLEILL